MPRIALISNPGSGSAGEGDVVATIAGAGWEVEEIPIAEAARAAELGVERIVVAGGDGSIAPAARAAAAGDVPLAVIPAGTANDFALRMGLPEAIEAAAELAAGGRRTRQVDLARVGGRTFVNATSLGLSPVAAGAAEELKDSLGALAYSIGAMQAATSEEPFECTVRSGDTTLYEGPAWQLTVGCTGAFGGGSRIDADADDGELDWVVIEGGPRARLAKHALGMRTGSIETQKGVRAGRCPSIEVSAPGCEELNVDGELVAIGETIGEADERIPFAVERHAFELVIG